MKILIEIALLEEYITLKGKIIHDLRLFTILNGKMYTLIWERSERKLFCCKFFFHIWLDKYLALNNT